jgi:hypothetical protein
VRPWTLMSRVKYAPFFGVESGIGESRLLAAHTAV